MSFNAIREYKIIAKISLFTVFRLETVADQTVLSPTWPEDRFSRDVSKI